VDEMLEWGVQAEPKSLRSRMRRTSKSWRQSQAISINLPEAMIKSKDDEITIKGFRRFAIAPR